MNFRRIEWIFLLAFILLDLFLIMTYFKQDTIVESTTNNYGQSTISSVMKSMKNDQITYPTLSNTEQTGYYLASPKNNILRTKADQLEYVTWIYANHKLTATFITAIKLNTQNPRATLDTVVKDPKEVIYGKAYTYSKELSNKNTIVYTQNLYGKPLYSSEGQIKITVKDGYAVGYTQTYASRIQTLREKKTTISQNKALMWLYQYNKLPQNTTVVWCKLGYTKLLDVNNSTVYIPSWIFYLKSKTTDATQYRRINAFTGSVMDEKTSLN